MKFWKIVDVKWIKASDLKANNYNPNKAFLPELNLLTLSLLENGWTLPILVTKDLEIIDGYHRCYLVEKNIDVFKITNNFMPVVILKDLDRATQMMATIRHNRARGSHVVLRMADIVQDLIDQQGVPFEEVQRRLGMEPEEVESLYDRGV